MLRACSYRANIANMFITYDTVALRMGETWVDRFEPDIHARERGFFKRT